MKKIVYLFGTGATQGKMSLQGVESSNIGMKNIGVNVLAMSRDMGGKYFQMQQKYSLPEDQDIELIMSLLEGWADLESSPFKDICYELRSLFRNFLISNINGKEIKARITSGLIHLHSKYGSNMGPDGEVMTGILTINYDNLLEEACKTVLGGLNCGCQFKSDTYEKKDALPILLKLHGSFNWKMDNNQLEISKRFEKNDYEDDYSGWIPPSVYKRPSHSLILDLWKRAEGTLMECDTLRIIGSSLRVEDLRLLSLIFNSRLQAKQAFDIEMILPDKEVTGGEEIYDESRPVTGIMQKLPFLGKMKNIKALREFKEESYFEANVYYSWVIMKWREIESNTKSSLDDPFLNEMLLMEA